MIIPIIKKSQKKLLNSMNDLRMFERDLAKSINGDYDFLEAYSSIKNLHDNLNDIRVELKDLEKHILLTNEEFKNV